MKLSPPSASTRGALLLMSLWLCAFMPRLANDLTEEPDGGTRTAVATDPAPSHVDAADAETAIALASAAAEQDTGATKTMQTTAPDLPDLPEVELASGALSYRIRLSVPPGRRGLTPELSLVYDSSDETPGSPVGYGWSLDIPSIVRVNKRGSDKLYSSRDFSSSMSGELRHVHGDSYGARSEDGRFLGYWYTDSTWIVRDKEGTRYRFGGTPQSRQDDPADPARVYAWHLDEVRDTNDNFIRYEYFKDNGAVYPARIVYGGHGSADGPLEIVFELRTAEESVTLFHPAFPVNVDYRISRIEARVQGQWSRRYELFYQRGDAGGSRMLLSSIQELGRDEESGVETGRPPTRFTYAASQPIGWSQTEGDWQAPYRFYDERTGDPTLIQFHDVNGDAYPDVVFSAEDEGPPDCQNRERVIWLSDGRGGWLPGACERNEWFPPLYLKQHRNAYLDHGTRIFDYNGDLLPDFVWAWAEDDGDRIDNWRVFKNKGPDEERWEEVFDIVPPVGFVFKSIYADNATQIADVNGDGLADILFGWLSDDGDGFFENVYLNTGAGWEPAPEGVWELPFPILDENPSGKEVFTNAQVADLNGDGLADIYWRANNNDWWWSNDPRHTYINNGRGWEPEINVFSMPMAFFSNRYLTAGRSETGGRSSDLNGDGLVDLLYSIEPKWHPGEIWAGAYINRQMDYFSFTEIPDPPVPEPFARQIGKIIHTSIVDLNADGMGDLVYAVDEEISGDRVPVRRTHLNQNHPFTDRLTRIDTPEGGSVEIGYELSSQYHDEAGALLNPRLPFGVTTVESITTDDGFGNRSVESYTYADGSFYYAGPFDRRFAGFGLVTRTDPAGNVTKTWHHQGNESNSALGEHEDHISKAQRPYRQEIRDDQGNLFQVTLRRWGHVGLPGGGHHVRLTRELELTYDGDLDHRDTAVTYAYDEHGNVVEERRWGEVTATADGAFTDVGDDDYTQVNAFASNLAEGVVGLPKRQILRDSSGAKVRQTSFYYDGLPYGEVAAGNLTTRRDIIAAGVAAASTRWSHDAFGNVVAETDPEGNTTSYRYDGFGLYRAEVENALGHVTAFTYDYSSGESRRVVDANGAVEERTYDGLDRPLEVRRSQATPADVQTVSSLVYDDQAFPTRVTELRHLDAANAVARHTYYDGLRRVVQSRTETEEADTHAVTDTVYDVRGLVERDSLPYGGSGAEHTPATTVASLYTTYEHDALERRTRIADAAGQTLRAYDDWLIRIRNPNGVKSKQTFDAHGNLVRVSQLLGGVWLGNRYTWDGNQRLTAIHDALGNVRRFTYDMLGRLTVQRDLRAPGDTTYGRTRYRYDLNGNVIKSWLPRGEVLRSYYDELDRPINESVVGEGRKILYKYDDCAGGRGRLCQTVTGIVRTLYTYFPHGLEASVERKALGQPRYTVSFAYDRQGNPLRVTYPDGGEAAYTYNAAGLAETVAFDGQAIVTDVDYAPTGARTRLAFANGVETTFDHDAAEVYRLRRLRSVSGAATLQDLTYAYDAVGNVTRLTDSSATDLAQDAEYTYDDLDRLVSASVSQTGNGADYTLTYEYDALGNMLAKSDLGAFTYDGHQGSSYANPHAATEIAGVPIQYDEAGNVIHDGVFSNTWSYRRTLLASLEAGVATLYTYDHEALRYTKTTAGQITTYAGRYSDSTDGDTRNRLYLGDALIATVDAGGLHFNHANHLGSTTVVTNETGEPEQLLDYYPFGGERIDWQAGGFEQTRRFTGHEHDTETGYTYAQARYLQPSTARFLSQDPLFLAVGTERRDEQGAAELNEYLSEPQRLNSYSYGINNPVAYVDKTGEEAIVATLLLKGFIGGVFGAAEQYGENLALNLDNGATGIEIIAMTQSPAEYGRAFTDGFLEALAGPLGTAAFSVAEDLDETGRIDFPDVFVETAVSLAVSQVVKTDALEGPIEAAVNLLLHAEIEGDEPRRKPRPRQRRRQNE